MRAPRLAAASCFQEGSGITQAGVLDQVMVTAAADGSDTVDLPALVQLHAATLFRVAFSVLRDHAAAEDVVQETFLRVIEQPKRWQAVREQRPWLLRVAWNLALDRHRRSRAVELTDEVALSLVAPIAPADRLAIGAEQLRRVLALVDALPRGERAVLLLSATEEMTTAEIAVVVGKSESAVRAMLFRARARLAERMKRNGGVR